MNTDQHKLYLDPEVFREFTSRDYERAVNRALPKLARALEIEDQPALNSLKVVLMRNIFPQAIEEIMALASEKQLNGESIT